jgi:hypothetical protein
MAKQRYDRGIPGGTKEDLEDLIGDLNEDLDRADTVIDNLHRIIREVLAARDEHIAQMIKCYDCPEREATQRRLEAAIEAARSIIK